MRWAVGSATTVRLFFKFEFTEEQSDAVQATGGLGRLEGVGGW